MSRTVIRWSDHLNAAGEPCEFSGMPAPDDDAAQCPRGCRESCTIEAAALPGEYR